MEGGIDADELVEFIEFQIFPSLSRYEASIRLGNNYEVAASGSLEPLLLHSPQVKELHSKGSEGTFKLAAPEDLNSARWFTKSSLLSFLKLITSSEVLHSTTALRSEISQLEEAHSFHVSLYEKDGTDTVTSNDSKNELLHAMYLRLTALREELSDAFAKASVITFSKEEIEDIEQFCSLFGATDLRKSLCKFVEPRQENQAETKNGSGTICEAKEDIPPVSRQSNLPVKYGWSPAKLAEIERQNSSESGESSDSSMEEQPSVERSRTLVRSASPRRSASPMRRVQIGRSGSRRTTPLTIKSLNFIPKSHDDELEPGNNNAEESAEQPAIKSETTNSRIISVQDAISLFESKQKDQIQKTNSFSNASIGLKKPVLRRWSTGLSGASNAYRDSGSDNSLDLPSNELRNSSSEVKPDHDSSSIGQNVDPAEIDTESDHYASSIGQIVEPDRAPQSESNDMISESVGSNQKESATAEWSRQKEAELDELLAKMMETKPVKYRKDSNQNSKTDEVVGEKKGGYYDRNKEKRNEKIQSKKNDGKQQIVVPDKRNRVVNKHNAKKTTSSSSDTTKDLSKPSVSRKASSKTSPLPATRKSWPSTPPPTTRTTGISDGITPSRRKPQPAPSVTVSGPTKSQLKATQSSKSKTVKDVNVKNQQPSKKIPTSTKAKLQNADADSIVLGKPSLYSKVTKKSSVVPLEPKPFLRKGSKVVSGARASPISKKKVSAQPDEPTKEELKDQILPDGSEIVVSASSDLVDPEPSKDHVIKSPDKSLDTHNQVAVVEDDWAEDELAMSISPVAWVDTEEHEDQTVKDNSICQIEAPTTMPSPRIRQSLSQMLLEEEETSEPDLNEWGNADSPTAMVFRKDDAPKGLKRLLKFARKSKTMTTAMDGNSSGWSSPSVFSEGEDDGEESKSLGIRSSSDNLLLKMATLNNGHQRSFYQDKDLATHGLFGRPNMNKAVSEGSLDNRNSTSISKTKATRPFFSLSAFRGSSK